MTVQRDEAYQICLVPASRDGVIQSGLWLDYGLILWEIVFLFLAGARDISSSLQRGLLWVPGIISPACEFDHSSPCEAKVKEFLEPYLHSPTRFDGVVLAKEHYCKFIYCTSQSRRLRNRTAHCMRMTTQPQWPSMLHHCCSCQYTAKWRLCSVSQDV
jgi:hypothetical protein